MFCKSILNEYAVKMNLEKPTYQTIQPVAVLPVFKSTSVFNGIHYTGETGKNKKEAEQLAARAAVISILGQPPSPKTPSRKGRGSQFIQKKGRESQYLIFQVLPCNEVLTFHHLFCRNWCWNCDV